MAMNFFEITDQQHKATQLGEFMMGLTYKIKEDHPALRAINYKQALSFINNEYDKETFYLKALFATRQFAKRQITWMRSWDNLELFDINEEQKILKMIKNTKEFQSFV